MTPPAHAADTAPLPGLAKPSLGVVRARLIAERLSAGAAAGPALPQVAATGKTGSGKSTLGNLLLGAADVLRSTGHVDCTDVVCRLRFPRGLVYVDLPGVASDDKLENFNRIALALPVHPELERPERIKVIDYDAREQSSERYYPADAFPPDAVTPDVIVYLIAPHQPVNRDEESYLRDLLRGRGASQVLLVFNLHHDPAGNRLATDENIADAREHVARCYQAVGAVLDDRDVVTIDCKAGTGLAELLTAMRRPLGDDRAAPLVDVISYQAKRASGTFGAEVHQAVAGYARRLAGITPASEAAAAVEIKATADVLGDYAAMLSGAATSAGLASGAVKALAAQVTAKLRIEHDEPVFREESKPVYRREPVYSEREVTDYSRPITRSVLRSRLDDPDDLDEVLTSVRSWFNGTGFGVRRERYVTETVGYEKKWISEVTGYRNELDHTETYQVRDGTRKVFGGYRPFGDQGTALALAAWYLALRQFAKAAAANPDQVYREILAKVQAHGGSPGGGWLPADAGSLIEVIILKGESRLRYV